MKLKPPLTRSSGSSERKRVLDLSRMTSNPCAMISGSSGVRRAALPSSPSRDAAPSCSEIPLYEPGGNDAKAKRFCNPIRSIPGSSLKDCRSGMASPSSRKARISVMLKVSGCTSWGRGWR